MAFTEVAVGVLFNEEGQILVAKRQSHQHLADFWEFPGGKIEPNEAVFTALQRELKEELGIIVEKSISWLVIKHDYGDKKVSLNVHKITAFSGEAKGCEGQTVLWVDKNQLEQFPFPKANLDILKALKEDL